MLPNTTELVPYSKATEIAAKYAAATAEIRKLIVALGVQVEALKSAFASEGGYQSDFDIQVQLRRDHYTCNADGAEKVLTEVKRAAWATLVEKLGIKKLMSVKKREELEATLRDRPTYHSKPEVLPEIDAETIMSVMSGFIQSAPEYLEESIREVYRWLIPMYYAGGHVTNKRDRVGKKVIKTYCVERGYGGALYRVNYSRKGELVALDSIFHAMDGKGVLQGHEGPLVAAITTAADGTGETDYFRFKCFKNQNLHLEFKRDDLLSLFNKVAVDGHRLGGEGAR